MNRSDINARVQELAGKYLDLVWFACQAYKSLKDGEKVCPSVFWIMTTYPEDSGSFRAVTVLGLVALIADAWQSLG
jgi:hypothetical protein